MDEQSARRSLRLLGSEMVMTSVLIAMPIMNVFYADEIGMSLTEVGLSQAACAAALLLLNIPTGWISDRFSRKWSNVLGDLLAGIALLLYATASSFGEVVMYEILFGIGAAFSNGVDSALLETYTKKLGKSMQATLASINSWRYGMEFIGVIVGGVIGAANPRLAIALSATGFLVGAVVSAWLNEPAERRQTEHSPLHDMWHVTRDSLWHNRRLSLSIAAFSLGREITHPLVWVLTPLLIFTGVPPVLIGAGWALNLVLATIGSQLAKRYADRLTASQVLVIGTSVITLGLGTLSIWMNIWTVALYGVVGLARGWFGSTLLSDVIAHSASDVKTTVASIADSASRLIYIPLAPLVVGLGQGDLRRSMIATLVIFVPLLAFVAYRLSRYDSLGRLRSSHTEPTATS